MRGQIWIDAIELGRRVGVPERSFVPPVPGETRLVTVQDWDKTYLQRAVSLISDYRNIGGTVIIGGHVDAWIILALGYSLTPACNIMYGAGLNGPGTPLIPTQLLSLKMGKKNPNLRFDCKINIQGDICYMDYRVDDPDSPPGIIHTFKNEDLPNLVLPVVPPDKHLFLHAQACYYVQINVANSYAKHVKSVSTAYHDCPYYHCAYSAVPEIEAGDATERPQTEWSQFLSADYL